MTKIEIDTNGFKGDYGIVKKGVGFDDQNFTNPTEFMVEASTSYYLGVRGGITSALLWFETDSNGKVKSGSIRPSEAAQTTDGKTLEINTKDLTLNRGGYRGELSTNLLPRKDRLSFKDQPTEPLKVITGMSFSFDTTAAIGCSNFRGIVKQDDTVVMELGEAAVTTGSGAITLNTTETTLTPVYGKLRISGQPDYCESTTHYCLITSICVRIQLLDAGGNRLGAMDFTPGQ